MKLAVGYSVESAPHCYRLQGVAVDVDQFEANAQSRFDARKIGFYKVFASCYRLCLERRVHGPFATKSEGEKSQAHEFYGRRAWRNRNNFAAIGLGQSNGTQCQGQNAAG